MKFFYIIEMNQKKVILTIAEAGGSSENIYNKRIPLYIKG